MSPASSFWDVLSTLLTSLLVIAAVGSLFAAPALLYRRYRRRYGQSAAFDVAWTEQGGEGPFRSGEQQFEARFELGPEAGWAAKLGFFLGILGMLWTPVVLMAGAAGLMPMVTVGLPGLLVSWSVFFASRAVLKEGPAGAPLLRFAAIAEIAVNAWVLVLIALSTLSDSHSMPGNSRDTLAMVLLVKPHDLDMYELPYSLQKCGIISLGYALLSLSHAWFSLQAWRPLEAARRKQAQAAQAA